MEQLIDPDWPDHFIARLEWINNKVSTKKRSDSEDGGMYNEHEYSSIGGTMIKVYFPTFPLLDTHPGALKGKITDKTASSLRLYPASPGGSRVYAEQQECYNHHPETEG
jgi:hypothetical protein